MPAADRSSLKTRAAPNRSRLSASGGFGLAAPVVIAIYYLYD
jgi:hypothetical protein